MPGCQLEHGGNLLRIPAYAVAYALTDGKEQAMMLDIAGLLHIGL